MKTSDFAYDLPPELIAQEPLPERSASRLLCLGRSDGAIAHRHFEDLPALLRPDDLLVFNDTRVVPARLRGHKAKRDAGPGERGGRVELLLERLLPENRCLAQLRVSKKPRAGDKLLLEGGLRWRVLGREGDFFLLESVSGRLVEELEEHGHVPLPPYIQRDDRASDRERYQTVYAARPGAVAAPTAGLHFDRPLLDALGEAGVGQARVTLHVGAGTFQPVRVENVAEHRMHAEYLEVSAEVCEAIAETRGRGGRVVAVGTTVVRSLETAAAESPAGRPVAPWSGDSRLFIYPGYEFRCVDALITNFHLPESTLLMLVSALAGKRAVLAAYEEAVRERYRFFSYGDAMLIA